MDNKNKKTTKFPKTQHTRIFDYGDNSENPLAVLDNPDDRITEQNGDGKTLVKNDNPDDTEIH